jgi:hypothetical protein
MAHEGGCQCGAIRYEVKGTPQHVALCYCDDCRKSCGAPMVSFAAFLKDEFTLLQGDPKVYNSSGETLRSFCGTCGTSLFYQNETFLPGIVDIQSATLDDPAVLPPTGHIQTVERIGWMATTHSLPEFERYPGM